MGPAELAELVDAAVARLVDGRAERAGDGEDPGVTMYQARALLI